MRQISVCVRPRPGGWAVECDLPVESVFFISGMRAELAAKSLAQRISAAGCDVRLVIRDMGETPVASHRYTSR